jgi:TolA-binding protein
MNSEESWRCYFCGAENPQNVDRCRVCGQTKNLADIKLYEKKIEIKNILSEFLTVYKFEELKKRLKALKNSDNRGADDIKLILNYIKTLETTNSVDELKGAVESLKSYSLVYNKLSEINKLISSHKLTIEVIIENLDNLFKIIGSERQKAFKNIKNLLLSFYLSEYNKAVRKINITKAERIENKIKKLSNLPSEIQSVLLKGLEKRINKIKEERYRSAVSFFKDDDYYRAQKIVNEFRAKFPFDKKYSDLLEELENKINFYKFKADYGKLEKTLYITLIFLFLLSLALLITIPKTYDSAMHIKVFRSIAGYSTYDTMKMMKGFQKHRLFYTLLFSIFPIAGVILSIYLLSILREKYEWLESGFWWFFAVLSGIFNGNIVYFMLVFMIAFIAKIVVMIAMFIYGEFIARFIIWLVFFTGGLFFLAKRGLIEFISKAFNFYKKPIYLIISYFIIEVITIISILA